MVRLRQRNVPEARFNFQIRPDGRSMILFIIIHPMNMAVILLYSVHRYEEHSVFEKTRLVFQNNRAFHDKIY